MQPVSCAEMMLSVFDEFMFDGFIRLSSLEFGWMGRFLPSGGGRAVVIGGRLRTITIARAGRKLFQERVQAEFKIEDCPIGADLSFGTPADNVYCRRWTSLRALTPHSGQRAVSSVRFLLKSVM